MQQEKPTTEKQELVPEDFVSILEVLEDDDFVQDSDAPLPVLQGGESADKGVCKGGSNTIDRLFDMFSAIFLQGKGYLETEVKGRFEQEVTCLAVKDLTHISLGILQTLLGAALSKIDKAHPRAYILGRGTRGNTNPTNMVIRSHLWKWQVF